MNQFDIVTVFKQCRYARIKSKTLGYVVRRKKKEIFRSLFFSSPQSHVREEKKMKNETEKTPFHCLLFYITFFCLFLLLSFRWLKSIQPQKHKPLKKLWLYLVVVGTIDMHTHNDMQTRICCYGR